MRIAVVCPYDLGAAGGVQQLTVELVDRLRRRGHDATLVAPGHLPGAIGVGPVVRVRGNASVAPVGLSPGVWGAVRRAVRDAEVVHVHEPLMPLASVAALTATRPTVATFHADAPVWVGWLYATAGRLLDRALARSVMTAVSPVAAGSVQRRWGDVTVVPNAIDVDAYRRGVERSGRRVVFLGRDDPRKGLDVLLSAWPAIRGGVPDAELVVMGTARHERIEGVSFVGRVDEDAKRSTLAASEIMVAPNTGGESFGIVVAEAMAAGAVVVASDIPAFRHVLAGTGRLVPPGSPEALVDAVTGLLHDPDEAGRLRRAAAARVEAFDWDVVVEGYLAAYGRALDLGS